VKIITDIWIVACVSIVENVDIVLSVMNVSCVGIVVKTNF
jgi:hypothetical protein